MKLLLAKLIDEAEQRAADQLLSARQAEASIPLKDGTTLRASTVESTLHRRAAADLYAFARELRELF